LPERPPQGKLRADLTYDWREVGEQVNAVARIRCHEALGRHWQSFDRVLIRRDFSRPYADDRREIEC
jgi:hypothetical protein